MNNEMLTYLAFLLGGGGSGSFIETGIVANAVTDLPVTFSQAGDIVYASFPNPSESMLAAFQAHWTEPIQVQFADDGLVRTLYYDATNHFYIGDNTQLYVDPQILSISDFTGNHSSVDSTTVTVNFVGDTLTENFQDALEVATTENLVAPAPATIYINWDDEKGYKDASKTEFTGQSDAQAFIGDSMPVVRDSSAVYTPLALSLTASFGSVQVAYDNGGSLVAQEFTLYNRIV